MALMPNLAMDRRPRRAVGRWRVKEAEARIVPDRESLAFLLCWLRTVYVRPRQGISGDMLKPCSLVLENNVSSQIEVYLVLGVAINKPQEHRWKLDDGW